jgi:hypothetical protein
MNIKINNFKKVKKNGGAAMITVVIFFIFISMAIISGLVVPSVREYKISNETINSKKSYYLAESGVEDAYYRILTNKNITANEALAIDNNTAETEIISTNNNKEIISNGDVLNYQRKLNLSLSTGTGVSFGYGVQTGNGGITMANGSVINGSVYSNGNIIGSGSITGTALSANSSALAADQTNGSGAPDHDISFGNANSTQDFGQSFEVSVTEVVNKVDLYIKKTSNPSSLTVKIVTDNGGKPGTTVIAAGSLSSSLISSNYGWVSVPFSSNPELTEGATYWIVIDGSTSSSSYYKVGVNHNGYGDGNAKIGQYGGTWGATNPSDADLFFKLYLGGSTGLIDGITVGTGSTGNAYAHTVNDSRIAGINYCKTGSGNNKSCDTTLEDPTQIAMPISDQNILDWKEVAALGGTYSGNYTLDDNTTSLGPKKITGNLLIQNGADLTVDGTLWVVGNMTVDNNATVRLSSSYGTSEGVIIVDGIVNLGNNSTFNGSGSSGSYLLILSTSTSGSAITLSNNGGAVILYAANGTVNLANNAGAKSLSGKHINMSNNTEIIYDSGLANANFVNGPSGGWNIGSWKETE